MAEKRKPSNLIGISNEGDLLVPIGFNYFFEKQLTHDDTILFGGLPIVTLVRPTLYEIIYLKFRKKLNFPRF